MCPKRLQLSLGELIASTTCMASPFRQISCPPTSAQKTTAWYAAKASPNVESRIPLHVKPLAGCYHRTHDPVLQCLRFLSRAKSQFTFQQPN